MTRAETQRSSRGMVTFFTTVRSRFRLFWLAPLLAFVALASWAVASPLGSAPDDDFHLASIWCSGTTSATTCASPAEGEREVPTALLEAPCFARDGEVSGACQLEIEQDPAVTTASDRGNFNNGYPPVFYSVMGLFASDNFAASALLMRLINVFLFVGITTALYALLPRERKSTLVWAWLVTTVPLGLFLLASNNPSSWAITGVGSAWLALLGYVESTGKRKIALGGIFALSALMAAGARGDAAIYIVLSIGIVAILTFRRDRSFLLNAILPTAVAIVALLFYLFSQQSGVAVHGLGTIEVEGQAPPSKIALLFSNLLNVPSLWLGIFTGQGWGLGWLDTAMPAVVFFGAFAVFIGVIFVGLRHTNLQKTISVLGMVLVVWLLPTYILVAGLSAVGQNVQPRYILPLFIVLAGVAVLTVNAREFRLSRFQSIFVIVALSVAQAVALHTNMRRYITGSGSNGWNLNQGIEWWWDTPISPMVVWVVGSAAFAALVTILVREIVKPHAIAA